MLTTYNRVQLHQALRACGVREGDVVFSHSNIGYFGYPEEGSAPETVCSVILRAFQDAIGAEGTLCVPTFTYSFCNAEPFDLDNTPSTCGMFTEFMRRYPGACRSNEPIFSVAALGERAEEFTLNVSQECFGLDSFWDRFFRADGVVCNLNLDSASTFLHFVERRCNVPYRYDKPFSGTIVRNGEQSQATAIYFCRDLSNPHAIPSFELIDVLARRAGIVRSEKVGRGEVVAVRAADVVALVERELKTNPWLLTIAGRAEQPA